MPIPKSKPGVITGSTKLDPAATVEITEVIHSRRKPRSKPSSRSKASDSELITAGNGHRDPVPEDSSDSETTPHPPPSSAESRLASQHQLREGTTKLLVDQQDAALMSMKRNMAITTAARGAFYALAGLLLLVVGYFVAVRFDGFVSAVLDARGNPDATYVWQTILAISTPVLMGLFASVICVGLALLVQSRGNAEFRRALDSIGRLGREGSITQVRSRALTQVLEETLVNARQAFALQLWISRVLFGVGVVLVFTFVGSLFFDNTLFTGGAVLSAVLSFAAAALFNPQRQIGSDLANITQLEAILGGYTRQAALIEEYVYDVIGECRDQQQTASASETVWKGITELSKALNGAIRAIDEHVEADDRVNPREEWLMQQLIDGSLSSAKGGKQPHEV